MPQPSKPHPCHIEELDHTADIGVRLSAPTQAALFSCAAVALFNLMRSGPPHGPRLIEQEIVLESLDCEALLVDWLNRLLFYYETTHAIFTTRIVEITPTTLRAVISGHQPAHPADVHIKAVTYHQLEVVQKANGWEAQLFVDI